MSIPEDLYSSILCPIKIGAATAQWPLELIIENGKAFVVIAVKNGEPVKLEIDASMIRHVGDKINPPYAYGGLCLFRRSRPSEQRANQAPEPTTMAVTSRAPSSTSRASHGRGSS